MYKYISRKAFPSYRVFPKTYVHKDTAKYVFSYLKLLELLVKVKVFSSKVSKSNKFCIISFFSHTQKCNFAATYLIDTLLCQRRFSLLFYFCPQKTKV